MPPLFPIWRQRRILFEVVTILERVDILNYCGNNLRHLLFDRHPKPSEPEYLFKNLFLEILLVDLFSKGHRMLPKEMVLSILVSAVEKSIPAHDLRLVPL